MRRALPMLVTAALLVGACSGSDDSAATTVTPTDTAATTPTAAAPPATDAPTTTVQPTTTVAPTTTIDDAATLAAAEAAYLQAFEVSKEIIRNPSNPENETLIREHFTGPNLEATLEALQLTVDGNFIARPNEDNPTFAIVVEPAEFVDDDPNVARMTVCEFNSDRIYEVGTAAGGGDSLVRDDPVDPVSILIVTSLELVNGRWRSSSGRTAEEVQDEVERCNGLS